MGLQECGLRLDYAQRELQPHGTREFPCAGYGARYTNREEDAIPWHWHEELELVYVEEGLLKLQLPGKTYRLGPGDGFSINANILHAAIAEPSCKAYSMVFSPLLITGGTETVFAGKYVMPLIKSTGFDGCVWAAEEGGSLFSKEFLTAFHALVSERAGYEFVVREKLSSICLMLYSAYEGELGTEYTRPDQDSLRLRKMLDYLHSCFAENLTLAEIAKAADIGERECLRCFQRGMQTSPVQYLLKYRVTQGASLLLRSLDSSISEVASRCGFDSPSNFSQTFKRFYRCTPREYRARQAKNEVLP